MSETDTTSTEEQPTEEEKVQKKVTSAFDEYNNKPEQATIDHWKASHGDVFLSGFAEEELFVFRALKRSEYRGLQEQAQDPAFDFDLALVQTCLLWQSVPDLQLKAGTVSTLMEQVMQNSNFVSPQMAHLLVTKL